MRRLGCFLVALAICFVAFTGSGILLKKDPAAWLPSGFPGSQSLRGWAKDLGLIPSANVGWAAIPAEPRPIIFLPGIMGSFLTDSAGSEVWPNLQGIASCIGSGDVPFISGLLAPVIGFYAQSGCDRNTFQVMSLSSGGQVDVANGVAHAVLHNSTAPGDPVSPLAGVVGSNSPTHAGVFIWGGSTDSFHFYDITAENASQSGYTIVHSDDTPGLEACAAIRRCFVPVGYDWRQSSQSNATHVLGIIDNVLAVTGSDRVDILAHSQGGLVANAIVHDPRSIGKIYRIVTLGTPFLGAPKVLGIVLDGNCALPPSSRVTGCVIDPKVLQALAADFPGVAELEPSRGYFAEGVKTPLYSDTNPLTSDQLISALDGSNPTVIDNAEAWHDGVDKWTPRDSQVGLLRMVGYDAGGSDPGCTAAPCNAQQATTNPDGTIVAVNTVSSDAPGYGLGDGTVPLYSANLHNPSASFDDEGDAHDMYWCAYSHMGLAQSTAVWQRAEAYLVGASTSGSDTIGGLCPHGDEGSLAQLSLVSVP
jgi:pimeloyl-ACP methyl ester carboxylesterase